MKKRIASVAALTLCAALLAGCAPAAPAPTPAAGTPATGTPAVTLSGTVATNGSTSMEKVIGALGETFMGVNTGVTVTYDPTGSGTGITAVTEKRADIGLASRNLKEEEKATLTETVLAKDGIAIIVNTANTVTDLTIEQIAGLFDGTTKNWSEVGGSDAPVVAMGREANSGTRDGFETIIDVKEKCAYSQEIPSTGGVIEAVKNNPNAIGYASLASVSDTTKTVTVAGIMPSEATVMDGTYTVQRDFVLATRTGEALSTEAQAYFDYITSAAAAAVISAAGAVPVAQ